MRMPDQPAQEDESEPKSVSHEALEDEVNKGIEIAISFADDSTLQILSPLKVLMQVSSFFVYAWFRFKFYHCCCGT